MKNTLEQIKISLTDSTHECQKYLTEMLLDFKKEAENRREGEEVLCAFEDMDELNLSPTFQYIFPNGNVGPGDPNMTEEGESFFAETRFFSESIHQQLRSLRKSCENETEFRSLEDEVGELVKEWLEENWTIVTDKARFYVPLYYCKHHWNYKIINIRTKEERILFSSIFNNIGTL